eukprot:TRINITY_DN5356_c0_g1_i1.p1 TRINITY_DN5356_c0_g1~~TRINITY_DN5356_c0_g1_i1.p1  ORF type:complete len:359 (+),score=92.25 TRINITY_DN5356_c0_g1_i1:526-1602(+)
MVTGPEDAMLNTYKEGDIIFASITSVDTELERVSLTLCPPPINTSAMYNKSKFVQMLRAHHLFHNPHALGLMAEAFALDEAGSLLPRPNVPPELLYLSLREKQNNEWAQDTLSRGLEHAKQGEFDRAIRLYQQIVEVVPQFKDAHIAWGAAYVKLNMLAKAIAQFEAALKIDPQNANARKYFALAREQLGSDRASSAAAATASSGGSGGGSGGASTPSPASPKPRTAASEVKEAAAATAKLRSLLQEEKDEEEQRRRRHRHDKERDKDHAAHHHHGHSHGHGAHHHHHRHGHHRAHHRKAHDSQSSYSGGSSSGSSTDSGSGSGESDTLPSPHVRETQTRQKDEDSPPRKKQKQHVHT